MTNVAGHLSLTDKVLQDWNAFWRSHNCAPTPVVVFKATLAGGVIMLAPLPAPWVKSFVSAQEANPTVAYETQGETLTEGSHQYLGSWAAFSAIHRSNIPTPFGRPLLPMAFPDVPDIAKKKGRWLA